jgi:indolepyruvate ferredoxin oxidoreductase, beta subunit
MTGSLRSGLGSDMSMGMSRNLGDGPITILVCALGGEGGGVLAEWLYQAAVRAGYPAQSTSIPGVAQRTGATTYYVEVHPEPAASLQGRRPVFSLNPVPGEIDLLLSSELLETARHVGNGMTRHDRTLVISSTARALTVAEKMNLGDGRLDEAALVAVLQRHARATELLDFSALARQAGTVISAVMLGAVAASGALPVARGVFEETIRASGKGVEASLRGFALAFDAITARRDQQAVLDTALAAAPAPDLRALARQRLTDYQDADYTRLYDERMARIEAAERASHTPLAASGAIAQEVTRWLALWMAFDDIVRVASAKLAASRMARVQREVGLRDGELLKVYDHFKPGVPELAGLLPPALAQRLTAWDRRRVANGQPPWALPMKIGSHGLRGALALRLVAGLKRWRRQGQRYALEQALIEQWLAAVERGAREHHGLGLELALCGRLIKGYGSTNERGQQQLLHIVQHLAFADRPVTQRAQAVNDARIAALADDAGLSFDRSLQAHGAPARPPREQVVRWFKRRPAG